MSEKRQQPERRLVSVVRELKDVNDWVALVDDLAEDSYFLRPSALLARGWIAVPRLWSAKFKPELADSLCAAMEKRGAKFLYAFETESVGTTDRAKAFIDGMANNNRVLDIFKIPATADGLNEYSHSTETVTMPDGQKRRSTSTALFYYMLVSCNRDFVILLTREEHLVIAGPPDFVREAVGGDIKAAQLEWRKIAESQKEEMARKYDIEIAERYEGTILPRKS